MGTDLHQTTITNLRWGINEAAAARTAPEEPVPWRALSQMALLGCRRPDASLYRTYPDVFVYPHPIDPKRGSLTIAVDGPPVLIVEVLSATTFEADLDMERGKGYSYERAGVGEYLALDPTREFLPQGIQAWRLVNGAYRPWEPDAQGHWQSNEVAVAIALEGAMATVYSREGKRMLREGEIERELERLQRLLDERG